jgi:GNAT superfamily N-acetyltransferase
MYRDVGAAHLWRDRLPWPDAEWTTYIAQPSVRATVLQYDDRDAGYFELVRHPDDSVEVAYFGLMSFAQGRGLGRWLLEQAALAARRWEPARVWLHTCTLDGLAALPNYLARGFVPYRTEEYTVDA